VVYDFYCVVFSMLLDDCILWNIYCDSVCLCIVKYVLWFCMDVYDEIFSLVLGDYVLKFLLWLCTTVTGEIFTLVVYDCILLNIYCVFMTIYWEILSVDLYDCKLWNIYSGCVWIHIVKYLFCFCMNVICEIQCVPGGMCQSSGGCSLW